MRVRLVRSGGVAGIRIAAEADSSRLPEARARDLARLVEDSGILSLPARPAAPASDPDRLAYRITVESEGREHTVELAEEEVTPALEPLLGWLVAHARDGIA